MFRPPIKTLIVLCLSLSCVEGGQPKPRLYDGRNRAQDQELKRHLLYQERPIYPVSASIHRKTASGVYWMQFDRTGRVVAVKIIESTNESDLDNSAVYALYRWRCRPGEVDQVIMPISFVANAYDAGIRHHP